MDKSEENPENQSSTTTAEDDSENKHSENNQDKNQPDNLTTDTTEPSEPSTVSQDEQVKTPEADSNYDAKNVHYEGDLAIYTEPTTGYQYQWSSEKNEWETRNETQYGFEDDTHVYTDKDGVKYFWDKLKNAWFPKIDDDFMAHYQMNYGFTNMDAGPVKDEGKSEEEEDEEEKPVPKKVKGEKRKASEPTWFEVDETQNTKVYVSNLPTDITEEEFVDFMQKCGLVMKDTATSKYKIKLYKEAGTGYLKGDALCTYIRVESVDLALKLLDGSDFKGKKVKIEKAKFQLKGEYDPKLKPKMRKKKDKLKLKKQQEKLFDWRPEKIIGERAKHEKVVIVKNLFEPSIFDKDVGLILEFQQDLREECSKLGEVRKVMIYDRHPEGVAQINMASPEEADEVVNLLNGRWFMKRRLMAHIWDGRTKYKIAETDAQISQRLDNWDKFLEEDAAGQQAKNVGDSQEKEKDEDMKSNKDNDSTPSTDCINKNEKVFIKPL